MKIADAKEKSKGIDDKLIALIDLKIEDDMKQVISELRALEKTIEANEKRHEAKSNLVLWVIALAFAILTVIVTLK